MKILSAPTRSSIALLTISGAGLVAAFVLGPAALLRERYPRFDNESALSAALGESLTVFWQNGSRSLPSELAELSDYWFRWHAIKIVISALLIVVLGLLAASLWNLFLGTEIRKRWVSIGCAVAAMSATVLALFSVVLLVLNIQATVVPLVALLPLLPEEQADGALAQTLLQISRAVDEPGNPQADSPAVLTLLEQISRYHWTMIIEATALSAAVGTASVIGYRRYVAARDADRPRRRFMYAFLGAAALATTFVMVLLVGAAVGGVADPTAALRNSLGI
ncbi:hypothetical protein QX204_13695 [Nocardia sp. PE-7]|uniref:hypothetical protein n=1 Tax=Nocardia sp. PE-7 TaxID=3058426 RepID=UPI00265A7BC6|nr:hypothetical protein [Nocardia sp. PE-7]WKG12456.1 hypothetical protein QX204_13695 [Nocardia sp. PE-7]